MALGSFCLTSVLGISMMLLNILFSPLNLGLRYNAGSANFSSLGPQFHPPSTVNCFPSSESLEHEEAHLTFFNQTKELDCLCGPPGSSKHKGLFKHIIFGGKGTPRGQRLIFDPKPFLPSLMDNCVWSSNCLQRGPDLTQEVLCIFSSLGLSQWQPPVFSAALPHLPK